jgi:hypothetical protein
MIPTDLANWTSVDVEERLREAEVRNWLGWLTPEDARLVRMRAERTPWKQVCREFGISRATAHRRLKYLMSVIAWRLNGRAIPSTWSRRYLLERARFLSSSL